MKTAGLLFLFACSLWLGEGPSTTSSSKDKDSGDSLVIGHLVGPDYLNPLVSQISDPSQYLANRLFPYLGKGKFECEFSYIPELAERWVWNSPRTEATFFLKHDIVWEDGTPVTADDVVFTFELILDPKVSSPHNNVLDKMRQPKPVEKVDDYTVRFYFSEAYNASIQMSHLCELAILPKHILKDADRERLRAHPFNRKPLSAGAFVFDHWTEGQEIVFTRNSKSKLSHPSYLSRVIFRIIPDYNVCLAELLSGGIDLMYGVQPQDLERVVKNSGLRVLSRGYRFLDYVVWNQEKPLFKSRKIRQALACSVDYEKLIDSFFKVGSKRYGKRATWTVTPELCDSEDPSLALFAYDLKEVKRLFEEEGWVLNSKTSLWEKEGKPFSFSVCTFSNSPRLIAVAQAIQEMFRKAGIEMKIEKREPNRLSEDLRKKNFDAALLGWQSDLWIDPSASFHSGYSFNFGSYSNPEVDDLLEEALKENNVERRKALWKKIHRTVYHDQPMLFLYWRDSLLVVHKRFQDVKTDILDPLKNLEDWWVPKQEQKYQN